MKDVNSKNKSARNGDPKHMLDDFGIFKSILRNVKDLDLDPEAFKKGVAEGIKLSSKFKALEEKERDIRTAYENGLRAGMAIVDGIEKDPYSQSTKDKLDDAVESFRKVTGSEMPNQLNAAAEAVKHAVENKIDEAFVASIGNMDENPSHQDQINTTPEKPKLEPIVQDRVARNRLPYKVSYGVSLASCGNTLPRASVVVEPKNDMMPMCMCIQEISAHRGTDPQKDLYISGSHNAQDDRLDVVFSVNTNGVYFNSDLRSNSFSALSFGAVKLTIADLFDVLKIYGFFEDFNKRTGYMTKCDAKTILTGIHIIPAVGCDSQLIIDIVMPGQYNEVLFTAIAMEYLRLFMVTWASRMCLPETADENEIFYINLITEVEMVIGNIWNIVALINASRENDQKNEEKTGNSGTVDAEEDEYYE